MTTQPNFFFLLISPPPEVVKFVASQKKFVRERIGHSYPSHHSKAHLTLFQYSDLHNESSLYKFQETISTLQPFEILVKDFNAFQRNGTIYLDVEYTHKICALAERLEHSIKPHITIARNLPRADFDRVWPEFQKRSYSHLFMCDQITVLRRVNGRWIEHSSLHLNNRSSHQHNK